MNFSKYILALVSCLYALTSQADVTINTLRKQNVEDMLLDQFIGSGVEISNATFNGEKTIPYSQGSQIASFDNNGKCIGLEIKTGIMMGTSHLSEIVKNNESFRFNNIDVTSEELYDLAWGYLPMMLNKEFKEKKEYISQYEDFHIAMLFGESTDQFKELIELLKTDDLLVPAYDYKYFYSDDYEQVVLDYEHDEEYEKLFPYYAIYKITNSLDPKYYNIDEETLGKLYNYLDNYSFESSFNKYYVNNLMEIKYDKTKTDKYNSIIGSAFYQNKSNPLTDEDLSSFADEVIFSPAILEFDFSTPDDSIVFEYAFASQEYPEYVGTQFNDAFALYVTDLTTGTQTNIATIPGTKQHVSINNVNEDYNSDYYIADHDCMKDGICSCNLQLGGYTKTLFAKTAVVPCRKYHLKIAIGNVADFSLQSAVFLKGGSFKSAGVSSSINFTKLDAYGISNDCSNGEITIKFKKTGSPTKVNIKHLGEAKNGVHYKEMPEQLIAPADIDSMKLDLIALPIEADSMEVAIVIETENECALALGDTIRTYIYNNDPISITPNEAECCATELSVKTDGFIKQLKWEPANLLSDNDTTVVHPKDCPTENVTYTITASNKFGCRKETAKLTVTPCIFDLSFAADFTTDNNTDELIEGCNEGQLKINVYRDKNNTEDLELNIKYSDTDNIVGLKKSLVIPSSEKYVVLPLSALKTSNPYHNDCKIEIECLNCKDGLKDTVIYLSTTQLEPLELAKETTYSEGNVKGLALEVPLISGEVDNVVWTPSDLLSKINKLKATLASDIENEAVFKVTATDPTGCQTAEATVLVKKNSSIEMTAKMDSKDKSSNFILNCNTGKLVLNITRSDKNGEKTEINLTFDKGLHLSGLKESYLIPAKETTLEIPLVPEKLSEPYYYEGTIAVKCVNCTTGNTDTVFNVSSAQLEVLQVEDITYKECEINGLDIEVPLISGRVGDVVWNPTAGLENIHMLTATTDESANKSLSFEVKVKDETGCQSAVAHVNVIKDICIDIEVPIFFTPNKDGENDLWKIKGMENTTNSLVRVYDRWGKLLHEFNPNNDGWDGTYNGNDCPSTDYWYEINCEELDKTYQGHFTLLR